MSDPRSRLHVVHSSTDDQPRATESSDVATTASSRSTHPDGGVRPKPVAVRTRIGTPTLDDAQLIRAMRDGDPDAATALYERTLPTIRRTLRRLLGVVDRDQDDVAQQVMIELVMTIDRFRGECSLDSWVSTLTAHLVYKLIRRRKLERRLFDASPADDHDFEDPHDLDRETSARSILMQLKKHLDAIEETKAWTFVLHDVLGYDLKEIAQITDASVAAAQSRLVRGRREVHERIAADPQLTGTFANLEADRGKPESR